MLPAMLRWCALLVWVVAGLLPPAGAAELRASKPEVRKEIVGVIEGQLAALRAGDAAKAYSHAAAAMRAQMPLRSFVTILQTNYAEIWHNTAVECGLVRDDGARATVLVQVKSERGEASFDYVLLKERNVWRIGSVLRHVTRKKDDV